LAADTGRGAGERTRVGADASVERVAFADQLILRVRELGHPLCVGLDPQFASIPPLFASAGGTQVGGAPRGGTPRDEQRADAVLAFLSVVIDRVAGRVAIVKPQIAFFEQLGWRGMRALEVLCQRAREAGLLVLLDAKRGDIGSTAEGYAAAYLGQDAATPVDALTVNPYLGFDTLDPFVTTARANGRGLFVLVKTSNPGSGDLQDREIEGEPLFLRVAHGLARSESLLLGAKTGWSSLGVVCGATWPDQALRVREALPRALFLVPGYGAQGGSASAAVASFVPGPNGLEGGIVNSSRAILFPEAARGTNDARAWERAFDGALDRAIDELGSAIRR
jgi:orotidine-5'-phosphate decarboxylase